MEDIVVLVLFCVGGYFAWKVLMAALKGIGVAGRKIEEEGPRFFGSVFKSMVAAIISSFALYHLTGNDTGITGAGALGIFAGVLFKEYNA